MVIAFVILSLLGKCSSEKQQTMRKD